MKKVTLLLLALVLCFNTTFAQEPKSDNNNKIVILWTSDDPMIAKRIAFPYPHNALKKGLYEEATLIVWGPSAKLLAEDKELQEMIQKMKADGVIVEACLACSDAYGVTEKLKELGIDVKYLAVPLTNYLKEDYNVLTF